jgi:dTMP kinase
MFIVLEGPDCSGKTTQATILTGRLRGNGADVLHLVFPSKSPAGVAARKLLQLDKLFAESVDSGLPKVLLQSAIITDRYSAAGSIQDCLRLGGIVIVDRWNESGFVYGGEDGLDLDWLAAAQFSLPEPDLRILLDIDVDTIMSRLQSRGAPTERYEQRGFQQRIITRYRNLWAAHRDTKDWRVMDGRMPATAVENAIYHLIVQRQRELAGFLTEVSSTR